MNRLHSIMDFQARAVTQVGPLSNTSDYQTSGYSFPVYSDHRDFISIGYEKIRSQWNKTESNNQWFDLNNCTSSPLQVRLFNVSTPHLSEFASKDERPSLSQAAWISLEDKIESIRKESEFGRDSFVSPESLTALRNLIEQLKFVSATPIGIVPTSDGGFLFRCYVQQIATKWEIDEDGDIAVMVSYPGEMPHFKDVEMANLKDFLKTI